MLESPTQQLRTRLRAAIERHGENEVVRVTQSSRAAVERVLSGLVIRSGTRALLEAELPKLELTK